MTTSFEEAKILESTLQKSSALFAITYTYQATQ